MGMPSLRTSCHPPILAALALVCALVCACSKGERASPSAAVSQVAAPSPASGAGPSAVTAGLTQSDAPSEGARRIIHTAELSVETDAPDTAAAKLASLAGAKGGFVVSSDTARSSDADGAETVTTTVVFRVRAESFDEALAAVRSLGTRVASEKITGQDVTEEYVDLEARIRAQRAVEEQYVAILHEAKTIPDVLAVQQKLGEVRTEIERAEGRRRLLENETRLSTITVHIARHIAAVDVSGPGFGRSIREAGHDAVAVAVAIINGAIRLVGVLLPVTLLVVAPIVFLVRLWLRRRARRIRG
jgi:hypothetical protein